MREKILISRQTGGVANVRSTPIRIGRDPLADRSWARTELQANNIADDRSRRRRPAAVGTTRDLRRARSFTLYFGSCFSTLAGKTRRGNYLGFAVLLEPSLLAAPVKRGGFFKFLTG